MGMELSEPFVSEGRKIYNRLFWDFIETEMSEISNTRPKHIFGQKNRKIINIYKGSLNEL